VTPPAFLRNVWNDLVEKKLWPVAIVLVAALVALPLTLGRVGGGETPVAGAGVPAADGKTDFTAYDGVDDAKVSDSGDRDVFDAPAEAKPKPASRGGGTTGSTAGSADAGAGTSASPSTGGAGWGADVPAGSIPGLDDVGVVPVGGTAAPTKDDSDDLAAYSVDIKFGQGATLASRKDIARLAPLPSVENPFFVYLGVLADGKTASFLVSSDAQATGDAKCLPSPQDCQRIEMEAGDTEFLDVVTPEGKTEQYQLDVTKVARVEKSSAEAAAAARARESSQGRAILRAAVETKQVDLSGLAYSRELGLVIPSGAKQAQASSLFGGYRVDLRFGAPNQLVKRYNLARLTPLPSVEEPSFVYLGVLADGQRSIFLNPSAAAASGDAVCDPSPQDCKRVTLKAGDSAKFDVATVAGGTTQYELAIDAITEIESDTPEEAAASRTRESEAGRIILRRLITEVGSLVADLNFSPKKAAVVERTNPELPQADPQAAPTPGTKPEGASTAPAPGQ